MPPPPAAIFGLFGADCEWVDGQMTPQAANTATDKVVLTGAYEAVDRTYVFATGWDSLPHFVANRDMARASENWRTYDVDGSHELMIDRPAEVANILVETAERTRGATTSPCNADRPTDRSVDLGGRRWSWMRQQRGRGSSSGRDARDRRPARRRHRGGRRRWVAGALQALAANAGLRTVHAPADCGGLGLEMVDRAAVFEEAGYSLFGPAALNISAPDEGDIHLLDHVATKPQRDRYLRPLVAGEQRSAFAMTEPGPAAGSDPAALTTAAQAWTAAGWSTAGSTSSPGQTGQHCQPPAGCAGRGRAHPGHRGGRPHRLGQPGNPGTDPGRRGRRITAHAVVVSAPCRHGVVALQSGARTIVWLPAASRSSSPARRQSVCPSRTRPWPVDGRNPDEIKYIAGCDHAISTRTALRPEVVTTEATARVRRPGCAGAGSVPRLHRRWPRRPLPG